MTDYGNPDHDPTTEADRPPDIVATEAIETALASVPRGSTIEAKANHVYVELTSNGWALIPETAAAEGNVHVLGPDEQIVTVPAGYEATVTRIAIDGPGDQLIDPELSELAEIVARLEALGPEARERVAGFVTHRYGPVTPVPVGRPSWLDITRPPGHDLPHPGRVGGETG